MKFKTIKEATQEWVKEFNAIPQGVLHKLLQQDGDALTEITPPAICDRVYVYDLKAMGEIVDINTDDEGDSWYSIKMDTGNRVKRCEDDFYTERDDYLPMWGTMWTFADSCDDYWLNECGGLQIMADHGFRIYEQEDFGYIFGIDGCGYDFYEAHWIPLYKARGLRWHDAEEVAQ